MSCAHSASSAVPNSKCCVLSPCLSYIRTHDVLVVASHQNHDITTVGGKIFTNARFCALHLQVRRPGVGWFHICHARGVRVLPEVRQTPQPLRAWQGQERLSQICLEVYSVVLWIKSDMWVPSGGYVCVWGYVRVDPAGGELKGHPSQLFCVFTFVHVFLYTCVSGCSWVNTVCNPHYTHPSLRARSGPCTNKVHFVFKSGLWCLEYEIFVCVSPGESTFFVFFLYG